MIDEIVVYTDKNMMDIFAIHNYISNKSYWGKGRTIEQVAKTIEMSFCFGIFIDGEQVGFTRVLSDTVSFAYVLDLYVLEEYRGKGLSRILIESMLNHEELQTVNWLLGTNDTHGLYEKYGFAKVEDPNRFMRKRAG
ncbi:MAG: GNAT superfamily N-acetyltransferase [Moritella dasanensis]|jgi:GNAT superfamily N-acetyltransferase